MKVWYDARTGKQVRYGAAIANRLRKLGHEVVLTTREHPDTIALAELLGESFRVVGKYDTSTLAARLRQSAKRILSFCDMFEENPPDVGVSHRSVELCRVAFGLGVPVISTHDTVHNEVISKLTMPLTDFLVVSKAVPERFIRVYGIKEVFQFDGVDEVAWIKDFEPYLEMDYGRPLIVVRQMETRATYTEGIADVTESLARKLARLGKVIFLSRYDKRPRKGLIVPQQFIDSASVTGLADLVISVGGTIAREAALQGTPSIVVSTFEALHVNDYLSKKGFPLFTVDLSEALSCAKRCIGRKKDVNDLLAELENPVDVIEMIVEEELCG